MVAETESELDFTVGFFADIALTIASFMLIFPIGIVFASLIIEYQANAARIEITPQSALIDVPWFKNTDAQIMTFRVTNPTIINPDSNDPPTIIFTILDSSVPIDVSDRVGNIIPLIGADPEESFVLANAAEAVIPLQF